MNKDDWKFKYGSTPWVGPYSSPEDALTVAANNADLTPAEEDLVVALILTVPHESIDRLYHMKDDHSAVMVTWQGRGWYVRVARKDVRGAMIP
jgi:hypothetical protein